MGTHNKALQNIPSRPVMITAGTKGSNSLVVLVNLWTLCSSIELVNLPQTLCDAPWSSHKVERQESPQY